MPIDDFYFYLAAIPAAILLGLAKGGFAGVGVLSMPLMTLVMSPVRAASIMLPVLIVQDAISIWFYRRTFDRGNLAIMLPGACIGIAMGYLFAAYVPDAAIQLAVGLIAVGFAARRLAQSRTAATASAPAGASRCARRSRPSPSPSGRGSCCASASVPWRRVSPCIWSPTWRRPAGRCPGSSRGHSPTGWPAFWRKRHSDRPAAAEAVFDSHHAQPAGLDH